MDETIPIVTGPIQSFRSSALPVNPKGVCGEDGAIAIAPSL
jgi:hypothetical protein